MQHCDSREYLKWTGFRRPDVTRKPLRNPRWALWASEFRARLTGSTGHCTICWQAFTVAVSTQFRWWKITCLAMRTILRLNFITKMANAKRANCFNWQNITVFHPICSPNLFAIWWIIEMSFAQRKACPHFVSGNRTDKRRWFRENRKRIVRRK